MVGGKGSDNPRDRQYRWKRGAVSALVGWPAYPCRCKFYSIAARPRVSAHGAIIGLLGYAASSSRGRTSRSIAGPCSVIASDRS
jgi:hypothetical protein